MFPFLSYSVVLFVLLAGFALGVILGWGLRDINWRRIFDPDGGKLVWLHKRRKAARARVIVDNVIEFPRERRAS
jgi:SH3-like domain-containing protein